MRSESMGADLHQGLIHPPLASMEESASCSYPGFFSNFRGLPSNPHCIYKTGPEWRVRQGPEAYTYLREARPIFNHPIQGKWYELGTAVYKYLDSVQVSWSTIDPVRFAEVGREPGPLHLWIGVKPGTLSLDQAKYAAKGCKDILANFPDVEIAFREFVYTRSTGPQLLDHVPTVLDPIAVIRSPFTPALGLKIASRNAPHYEGTGGLYFREKSGSDEVFLLTSRHVALPPPRLLSLLLGTEAYEEALKPMSVKIRDELFAIDACEVELKLLGEAAGVEAERKSGTRDEFQALVKKAKKTIAEVDAFHGEITKNWSMMSQRLLGYIFHAPPISVGAGPQMYTEDWAMIKIYLDKINWNKFRGNVIDLNKITPPEFVLKMRSNHAGRSSPRYPLGGLLQVRGFVPEHEIHQPTQFDPNGEECFIVLKNGNTTGVTFGRGTGMESFIRTYSENGIPETAMGIAIYPYSNEDGPFSAPGDSGSIVVDGEGRIVGLLSGGAGASDRTDVTYLTPYFWLEPRIKEAFPDCYLYPTGN
ncbi:hypothetical protein BC834DRAFT_926521 [Gloeopeniophorella convolvens]|nr:hypothetical protein BC834DRAFT_926521 [Gloeopeniophorella convolvens]